MLVILNRNSKYVFVSTLRDMFIEKYDTVKPDTYFTLKVH